MSWLVNAIHGFGLFVIVYFTLLNGLYLLFTAIAWRQIVRHRRRREYLGIEEVFASPLTPPISVILPAFNEEEWVVDTVRSLLRLRYPEFEVIVIDDGSTDGTPELLAEAYELIEVTRAIRDDVPHQPIERVCASRSNPELLVVRKRNGGSKADALNAGLNVARFPYICVIDADEVLERDGLLRVARPMLDDPEGIVATGGIVRIANGCTIEDGEVLDVRLPRSRLATLQVVEYFRSFLAGRVAWSAIDSLLIVSGAWGLFNRRAVIEAGGYEPAAIGEDIELVMRLHKQRRGRGQPCRVVYTPEVVVWTEVPEDFAGLAGQRRRWQRGLADTLWRHRAMTLNPRYGLIGLLGMPFFILFELLGCLVELIGYVMIPVATLLGVLELRLAIAFAVVALLLGVLQTVAALAAVEFSYRRHTRNRDALRMFLYAFVDNLGYRQLLAWWRLQAFWDLARGERGWGTIARQGAVKAGSSRTRP